MATRRHFLKSTAITAAGLGIAPAISGNILKPPASDRINIGLIGCNGMGFSNLNAFLAHPQVECLALCDIDESVLNRRAADVEKNRGKKPANLYRDWRRVIDNKDINLVIVGTPDHWHCLQMVAACEAGKDVYCEKPLGRTIGECNLMIQAAKKNKSVVQVG
ncbi:MAG TPA: Gfo/Idh/MocA family oxidoreductase [Bacteroidales bacterium]|nr:Gfo/Idh/MocA family oxidoreductase [Bacteroidales bacterium]